MSISADIDLNKCICFTPGKADSLIEHDFDVLPYTGKFLRCLIFMQYRDQYQSAKIKLPKVLS